VLAHPRKPRKVQARCYACVLHAIAGPDKRCLQGPSLIRALVDPARLSHLSNGVPSRDIAAPDGTARTVNKRTPILPADMDGSRLRSGHDGLPTYAGLLRAR